MQNKTLHIDMKPIVFFFCVCVTLVLIRCAPKSGQEMLPDMKLAAEFEVDSTQLAYQYYQKFGFTDVCEDLRMVSKLKVSPNLKKKLPIEPKDLEIINEFPNKVDRLEEFEISFDTNARSAFHDMELKFIEFISDTTLSVQLEKGEYEISQTELLSVFKVYDSVSGLLYIEVHRCDEK